MHVLIVGSGGREHALAWKVSQSPLCKRLWTAPGNAGTAALGENVPIQAEDTDRIVAFARNQKIDLVIIGPETALEAGLADALQAEGIAVFGPSQAAARIETSKVFAKQFMDRHGIPTARSASFSRVEDALRHIDQVDYPIVIKTSGLAAGKGVFLPDTLEEARQVLQNIMVERAFGSAGDEVVVEERLSGEEVSLLAFTDGITVRAMPPAQDHKRLLDGDHGPNTGGMGAYAPTPVCPPEMARTITQLIMQRAVDGLRAEGCPFHGVLYGGLILTEHGPFVLEFNCRFGDPETQVILPLLDSDLVEIAVACASGTLDRIMPIWKPGACATVVLASAGYPGTIEKGKLIHGLKDVNREFPRSTIVFHAGTRLLSEDHQVVTAGGRVLDVTATGGSIRQALGAAYQAVRMIHFGGMQYRKDIGAHAFEHSPDHRGAISAYTQAGVNIDAGNRAVDLMRDSVASTYTPAVLAGIGSFGGLLDAKALQSMHNPVLVASTDGVGTKVSLAASAGRYESIGVDIVNHCINDILVQGARPLFFLDYFAAAKLHPQTVACVVAGIASACREAGCVVLGGETAEMPGVYVQGAFDLAGTIVGVVERDQMLPRQTLQPGDLLVGLASSGPHTNGYSLIRRIFAGVPLDTIFPELGISLADALLAPHRSYLGVLEKILAQKNSPVKALAHLTGGGFYENIPRILPEGLRAVITSSLWETPALFKLIQSYGAIENQEMYRVFNMGIGMVAVIGGDDLELFRQFVPEPVWAIGQLEAGEKGVEIR